MRARDTLLNGFRQRCAHVRECCARQRLYNRVQRIDPAIDLGSIPAQASDAQFGYRARAKSVNSDSVPARSARQHALYG
jgi:hypothetical protein